MKLITSIVFSLLIFTTLLISGCGNDKVSIYTICDEQAQICNDIDSEGWCKYQRADLIQRRYKAIKTPGDQDNQYRTLMAWRDFHKCIKTAADITRKTVLDRTSAKAKAYLVSIDEIEHLEQQTSDSKYPQLLYYHWVYSNNNENLAQLLKLDKRDKLATTELQLMMASYYAKVDKKKEIRAQYKALEYLNGDEETAIDNQLFASLATSFLQQKNYRLAYIWTKIAEESGLKSSSSSSLLYQLKARSIDLERLQKIANKTYDSIESRSFVTPESQL